MTEPTEPKEGPSTNTTTDADTDSHSGIDISITALPRLLEAFAVDNGGPLDLGSLEAVRHLPSISEGPVYSVREHIRAQAMGRNVVAKVLRRSISPSAAGHGSRPCTEAEFARLVKEIKLLNHLPFLQHGNIVTLKSVEFGIHSGQPFELCPILVLEKAPLGSLDASWKRPNAKHLPWSYRLSLCFDIANGLAALHRHGILHGDLKPSHVLLFPDERQGVVAKLTGLGGAHLVSGLSECPTDLGTAPWRAPEIEEQSVRLDQILKTDLFSLGLLFWSIYTMNDPFANFDLPLDVERREENIKSTLYRPYFFRCIPLLVEHEVRDIDKQALAMLGELSTCTVRLSPMSRDLDKALSIAAKYTGRWDQDTTEVNDNSSQSIPEQYQAIFHPSEDFDLITIVVSELQELSGLVAKEYAKALSLLLQHVPVNEQYLRLRCGASWTLFLCHFYGYGTQRSVSNALKSLKLYPKNAPNSAGLVPRVIPILHNVFKSDIPLEDALQYSLDTSLADWPVILGPWTTPGKPPPIRLLEHGVEADMNKEAMLGHMLQLQTDASVIEKRFGAGNTLLHGAALFGLSDQVAVLCRKSGLDINAENDWGETALFLACQYGHIAVAYILLACGADANAYTDKDESCLHWLCSCPRESVNDLASKLIMNGAHIGFYNSQELLRELEWTSACPDEVVFLSSGGRLTGNPLMRAIANRDIETVQVLLHLCREFILSRDPDSQLMVTLDYVFGRALRLACELHLADTLDVLCTGLEDTALCLSDEHYKPPVTELFQKLRSGEFQVGDFYFELTGSTALTRAALDMSFHIQRLAYHGKEWVTACHETIRVLAKYGFLLTGVMDERGGFTNTAPFAIRCGNDEALRTIIELSRMGEDQLSKADTSGYTLVHHAIAAEQLGALEILAESGATLDLRKRRDPGHCLTGAEASYIHVIGSCRLENPAFTRLFLQKGGVPASIKDGRGISALSLALTRGAFSVARVLIEEGGASLAEEGRYGLTPLGEMFLRGVGQQYDDLLASFKFLLSYEDRGFPLFITGRQMKYSVLHTAAQLYTTDELYPILLDLALRRYNREEHLEAKANNPGKSTPLLTAIAMLNPTAVEALVGAGASLTGRDTEGRTPLKYALELHARILQGAYQGSGSDRDENLERIVSVILILFEKGGSSDQGKLRGLGMAKLNTALDEAKPLLEKMKLSEHKVARMRSLERETMAAVSAGYHDTVANLGIEELDLLRRIVLKRVRPCLIMEIEFRIIPSRPSSDIVLLSSYAEARNRIPWGQLLSDREIGRFQQAAALEWLRDLIQSGSLPENHTMFGAGAMLLEKFALTGRVEDIPLADGDAFVLPPTLLQWYEAIIQDDKYLGKKEDREQTMGFLATLRAREEGRLRMQSPLPAFDDAFCEFHFDRLQPRALSVDTGTASFAAVLQCRCAREPTGMWSRFDFMRICQYMASIDNSVWSRRLIEHKKFISRGMNTYSEWKQRAVGQQVGLGYISIMQQLLVDLQAPESAQLLAHPESQGDAWEEVATPETVPGSKSAVVEPGKVVRYRYPYLPLDFDRQELRFLKLLPTQESEEETDGLVECMMEQHPTTPDYWTEEYRRFMGRLEEQGASPEEYHNAWATENPHENRFQWGDFSCLSYTWGNPSDTKSITVDGHEVTVGANLEAALRCLRTQGEFQGGLLLWADALCINQDDLDEKDKVVRNMHHIYRVARNVTAWLGASDERSGDMVQTVRDFVAKYSVEDGDEEKDSKKADENTKLLDCPSIWYATTVLPALVYLFDRPYWRRLWIMQEITASALCENLFIGPHVLPWTDLVLALRHHMRLRDLAHLADEFTETHLRRVLETMSHAYALVSLADAYRRSLGLGRRNYFLELGSWSSWIYLGSTAQVTNERDRVYGLLGLLNERIASRVSVQYANPVEVVYRDFSRALFEGTGSLDDVLAGSSSVVKGERARCSWAIDLRDLGARRVANGNATAKIHHRPAPAILEDSEETPMIRSFREKFKFSEDGSVLMMWCLPVDTVEGIAGNTSGAGDMPWTLPEGTLSTTTGSTERETLLRILHADALYTDSSPPGSTLLDIPWFDEVEPDPSMVEQLLLHGWWEIIQMDQFRAFHRFRRHKADFVCFQDKPFKDFFPRGVEPCVGKEEIAEALGKSRGVLACTLISTARGRLGSTCVPVEGRDEIYIVPGCSYPVLMRREEEQEEGDQEGEEGELGVCRRVVVGECYVDGLMEGEGLAGRLEEEFVEIHGR